MIAWIKGLFPLSYTDKKHKTFLCFLFVILASLLIVYLPFIVQGKSLIWGYDGVAQHATFLKNFIDNGWLSKVGEFDFSIGMGADFLTSYSYYMLFDPFTALFFVLPFGFSFNYSLIIIIKYVVSAFLMFFYLKNRNISPESNIIASILYMLCGFAVTSFVRHPFMTAGIMYLPMIMLGIDRLFAGKRPYILIAGVALCLLSSFYMFFMVSVFAVMYCIIQTIINIKNDKSNAKSHIWSLVKTGLFYALGIVIAGVLLAPFAYGFLTSAKSEASGLKMFSLTYYIHLFINMNVMSKGPHYTPAGFSIVLLIVVALGLRKRSNTPLAFKILLVGLGIGLIFPLVGYAFNLFNYVNNRWVFLLQFCMMTSCAYTLDNRKSTDTTTKEVRLGRYVLTTDLCFGLGVGLLYLFALSFVYEKWLFVALCALGIIGLTIGAVFLYNFIHKNEKSTKFERKFFTKKSLMIALIVACCLNAFAYNIFYSFQFVRGEEFSAQIQPLHVELAKQNDDTFFRTDKINTADPLWDNQNNSVLTGYFSANSYNTISSAYVEEFMQANAVYNEISMRGITGLGNRSALESLLSVKYFITDGNAPYGFVQTELNGNAVYENQNFIPFGFVYNNTMSKADFDRLPTSEKQFAMLECAVVDGQGDYTYTTKGETPDYETTKYKASLNKNSITIAKDGKITFTLNNVLGKEVYIDFDNLQLSQDSFYIDGVGMLQGEKVWCTLNVKSDQFSYMTEIYPKGAQKYTGITDFEYCMGVATTDSMTIELSFLEDITATFDNISITTYDMADFSAKTQALADEHLTDYTFDGNTLKGKINLANDGRLFLSIPYSKGWTAKVDGVETKIDQTNVAFMSLELTAGEHNIELVYETPFLSLGVKLSIGGGCILIAYIAVDIAYTTHKKRKNRSQPQKIVENI
ncbi:MAG: YfhO family protein [Clostridia bacterium]